MDEPSVIVRLIGRLVLEDEHRVPVHGHRPRSDLVRGRLFDKRFRHDPHKQILSDHFPILPIVLLVIGPPTMVLVPVSLGVLVRLVLGLDLGWSLINRNRIRSGNVRVLSHHVIVASFIRNRLSILHLVLVSLWPFHLG